MVLLAPHFKHTDQLNRYLAYFKLHFDHKTSTYMLAHRHQSHLSKSFFSAFQSLAALSSLASPSYYMAITCASPATRAASTSASALFCSATTVSLCSHYRRRISLWCCCCFWAAQRSSWCNGFMAGSQDSLQKMDAYHRVQYTL